jgi:hypothetical protein
MVLTPPAEAPMTMMSRETITLVFAGAPDFASGRGVVEIVEAGGPGQVRRAGTTDV